MRLRINRRHLTTTSLLLAASTIVTATTLAQATPEASPVVGGGTLAARVAARDPEALLETLHTAPVETPLLPAAAGNVVATPWDDSSDTDLDNALGGASLVTNGTNGDAVGHYIVFADALLARGYYLFARDASGDGLAATAAQIDGFDGVTIIDAASDAGYAVTVVQVANVVAIGGWEQESRVIPDVALATGARWSVVNALALIDHLDAVTR
jgi:hypothetical protein